jgi:hypothetical protein
MLPLQCRHCEPAHLRTAEDKKARKGSFDRKQEGKILVSSLTQPSGAMREISRIKTVVPDAAHHAGAAVEDDHQHACDEHSKEKRRAFARRFFL